MPQQRSLASALGAALSHSLQLDAHSSRSSSARAWRVLIAAEPTAGAAMLRLGSAAASTRTALSRGCQPGCTGNGDLLSQIAYLGSAAARLAEVSSATCHSCRADWGGAQSPADAAGGTCPTSGLPSPQHEHDTQSQAVVLLSLATWQRNQDLADLRARGCGLPTGLRSLHSGTLGHQRRAMHGLWSQQARHLAHRHGPKQRPEEQHMKPVSTFELA